jgi:serine/threonine-protein kinase
MAVCVSCSKEIPQDSRLCPHCGTEVVSAGADRTVTTPQAHQPVTPLPIDDAPSHASSSDTIDEARFTPGTMLTERYRVVGLLGTGGMGEVYRADDLRLRQPVALKFLPAALSKVPRKLERFHHEVRVARQVSHPNVCRVYDIGEAQGQPFISMEYVDGEDLAKVLRRMGKPSQDKALQIARQLCAGLAAAHDKGVLHRDLKPHNVMIDGQGRVRITDFGLAGFVGDFAGGEIAAGTPAYMAPEQIAGREVSVKSDVYSLGLVLFELFTGKRLFEGNTREQISQLRSSTSPTTLSGYTDDMDPAIERVILRCLETEPSARPSSALAVAAALPGGDPLAAALAAGETPDPEMVAAAGQAGGMNPVKAILCLAGIVVGCIVVVALSDGFHKQVPLPKPPAVLADDAAETLQRLGFDGRIADKAFGFQYHWEYIQSIKKKDMSKDRWNRLSSLDPSAILFWYRQSPKLLIPEPGIDRVTPLQPPFDVAGMARVFLDPSGRLVYLDVVPLAHDERSDVETAIQSPNWSLLFNEAGLDMAAFSPTEPTWTPSTFCDARAAWEGHYPEQRDVPIRIEAGAYRGMPSHFRIVGPWTPNPNESDVEDEFRWAGYVVFFLIMTPVFVGSGLIARQNLRRRRGDRHGAIRLASVFLVIQFLSWSLEITYVPELFPQVFRLINLAGLALFLSGFLWLLYIAVEPYVRRYWPQVLIAWSRLLSGRLRDPLIGRDIMIGMLFGLGQAMIRIVKRPVLVSLGAPPAAPGAPDLQTLCGGRFLLGNLLTPQGFWWVFFFLFLFFILRLLLKRQWLAFIAFVILVVIPGLLVRSPGHSWLAHASDLAFEVLQFSVFIFALIRFGLVAAIAAQIIGPLLFNIPLTFDVSVWYSNATFVVLGFMGAMAIYGFHTALAGRSLFKDELPDG